MRGVVAAGAIGLALALALGGCADTQATLRMMQQNCDGTYKGTLGAGVGANVTASFDVTCHHVEPTQSDRPAPPTP